MAEERDYKQILEKARRRRKWASYKKYIMLGASLVVLGGGAAVLGANRDRLPWSRADEPAKADARGREAGAEDGIALSEEQQQAADVQQEQQAVVDAYQELGLVQLEDPAGQLNIRETPGTSGAEVGLIHHNGACEILGSQTVDGEEWYQIRSGEAEGYISSRFVITGEEARKKALENVRRYAVIDGTKLDGHNLRIRSEPVIDESGMNVVGQALAGERYAVEEEADGWLKLPVGYISAEFATIEYGLDEAQKLDERTREILRELASYEHLFISNVQSYQNIRSEPSTESDKTIIGKLTSMAGGEILEQVEAEGRSWYKVKSGNITGYVAAEHVATGQTAKNLARQNMKHMVVVDTPALNVRSEPNRESKIWTVISKEERYEVIGEVDENGWVQIELDTGDSEDSESSDKAYVCTGDGNAEVKYMLNEAIKFSPLEEKENQQASLRSKVVNYALQFVGGRYVWGGTNPHTGADCSGFVQYVMRNVAGVSLPRTSREQAKTGRSIKSGEMKPGDLIFYANKSGVVNHVAMYIGNGQIVHAASRRSGIKISTWNYRTPKTIRRYLD